MMSYSKKLVVCCVLSMAMHTVMGMKTSILFRLSDPARQPKAKVEAIKKRKLLRQEKVLRYKECLPQIRALLSKSKKTHDTLQAFLSQMYGDDACQTSRVEPSIIKLLDASLVERITEIDRHSMVCKTLLAPQGISLEKKLLIVRMINRYRAERNVLQKGLACIHELIRICDNQQSTVDSDSDTEEVYYSCDSDSDDETSDSF